MITILKVNEITKSNISNYSQSYWIKKKNIIIIVQIQYSKSL